MRSTVRLLPLIALALLATAPASAQSSAQSSDGAGIAANPTTMVASTSNGWTQFLSVTCGSSCADPMGEMSTAQQNWSALQSMGTTDWIGSSYNGVTIDASALLAAARVVGATQVDDWLRTGDAPSQSIVDMITSALAYGAGYDVSSVTGVTPASTTGSTDGSSSPYTMSASSSSSGVDPQTLLQQATANSSALGIISDGINILSAAGNGTQTTCNPSIAGMQNANAQSFIGNMMKLITGDGTGFSQLGGTSVSSGQRSANGVFGSGCLDKLMSGSMDTLFTPPGLSSLIGQLGSMFGGASSGASGSSTTSSATSSTSSSSGSSSAGCGNAPAVSTQIAQSFPQAVFTNSAGGFFPALGFSSGEDGITNASIPLAGATSSTTGGFSSMFASNAGSGSTGTYTGSTGYTGSSGTVTYPNGQTGSATDTPGGGGYSAQGTNPSLDSKLLQGHSISTPNGN